MRTLGSVALSVLMVLAMCSCGNNTAKPGIVDGNSEKNNASEVSSTTQNGESAVNDPVNGQEENLQIASVLVSSEDGNFAGGISFEYKDGLCTSMVVQGERCCFEYDYTPDGEVAARYLVANGNRELLSEYKYKDGILAQRVLYYGMFMDYNSFSGSTGTFPNVSEELAVVNYDEMGRISECPNGLPCSYELFWRGGMTSGIRYMKFDYDDSNNVVKVERNNFARKFEDYWRTVFEGDDPYAHLASGENPLEKETIEYIYDSQGRVVESAYSLFHGGNEEDLELWMFLRYCFKYSSDGRTCSVEPKESVLPGEISQHFGNPDWVLTHELSYNAEQKTGGVHGSCKNPNYDFGTIDVNFVDADLEIAECSIGYFGYHWEPHAINYFGEYIGGIVGYDHTGFMNGYHQGGIERIVPCLKVEGADPSTGEDISYLLFGFYNQMIDVYRTDVAYQKRNGLTVSVYPSNPFIEDDLQPGFYLGRFGEKIKVELENQE